MNRKEILERIRNESLKGFDLLVIGGGATGLGLALDGASRGYRTMLLEQSDFAKGTSSRSTKLVHGGVRYLGRGELRLVMEALRERGILFQNAPHLVYNQEFIIPVFSWFDAVLYTIGLMFYDFLAGRLSFGRSKFIPRKIVLKRMPLLIPEGLKGGIVYHDGGFDDARLAMDLLKNIHKHKGIAINYCKVTGLSKNREGKITGARVTDQVSGEEFNVNAGLVVNATGVFADNIIRMDNPAAGLTVKPSQGIHLVINSKFLNSASALMIPKTSDGRVLFAIPWYNKVVVGTTDTPVDKIRLEPAALEKEISFILRTMKRYFLTPPRREDIRSIYAGLRPLAANPSDPSSTRDISRRHKITVSAGGLITVTGGKWTTYRRMAEETLDKAIKTGILPGKKCITRDLRLSGKVPVGNLRIYGDHAAEIQSFISQHPESGIPVHPGLPVCPAEISWICRNEMPVHLEDVLARRTRALFLDARMSLEIAPLVAGIMQKEMSYPTDWVKEELEAYRNLVQNYFLSDSVGSED